MDEKFTKGEWIVEGCQVVLKEYPEEKRCFGYGCDERFICCLDDGEYHQYHDEKEMEANAKLIAAAPNMFALLKMMLEPTFMGAEIPEYLRASILEVLKKVQE